MKDREFCMKLKAIRERQGMTQSQLDYVAGLPSGVIAHYESGTRTPGLASLKSIIRGLQCSADELIGEP